MGRFGEPVQTGIGSKEDRSAGKLGDRDMIRMAIGAFRSERRDDMGPDSADVSRNLSLHLTRIGAVQVAGPQEDPAAQNVHATIPASR